MTVRRILLFPLWFFWEKIFGPIYRKKVAGNLASLCEEGSYILDFGCDDGGTAALMMRLKPSLRIVGLDIQENRPCFIPRTVYNGRKIPFSDKTFDAVLAIDVLHHTKDISYHLREMKRVCKKHLIIKDHGVENKFSHLLVCLTDFLSNLPYGVKCAFNFPSLKRWQKMFQNLNLKLLKQPKDLYFGFGLNSRYNLVFKLKKN